jgi:hypothetical protein
MSDLPAAGYWANAARVVPEGQVIVEQVRSVIAEMPGGGTEVQLTIGAAAAETISPAINGARMVKVETEGGAGTDDLKYIAVTNVPDGALLILRCTNPAHVVTAKHAAGGTGQINLLDSVDAVLDDLAKRLVLQREGSSWVEVGRFGFRGHKRRVILATGSFSLLPGDSGALIVNLGAGGDITVTLPAAAAGLEFEFCTEVANKIKALAVGDDTISDGASTGGAAGNVESTAAIGNRIRVTALNGVKWRAVDKEGSWTLT